jgi:hypothetical protein
MFPTDKEMFQYINTQPTLVSMLYDLDLLPEQILNQPDKMKILRRIVGKFKETKDLLDSLS